MKILYKFFVRVIFPCTIYVVYVMYRIRIYSHLAICANVQSYESYLLKVICLTGLCKSVISAQEMKCVLLLNISIATYSHNHPLHTDKTVVQNISLSYYK